MFNIFIVIIVDIVVASNDQLIQSFHLLQVVNEQLIVVHLQPVTVFHPPTLLWSRNTSKSFPCSLQFQTPVF